MNSDRHKPILNLQNLESIARGDSERMLKYLKQFQELIPERLEQLKVALTNDDRIGIRQILHKMSPQLQFFGIEAIIVPIQRLEYDYDTMPYLEIEVLVNDIIYKLEGSLSEISNIIQSQFE